MYALAYRDEWTEGASVFSDSDLMRREYASQARTGPLTVVGMGGSSQESTEWPWWLHLLAELVAVLLEVAMTVVFG